MLNFTLGIDFLNVMCKLLNTINGCSMPTSSLSNYHSKKTLFIYIHLFYLINFIYI